MRKRRAFGLFVFLLVTVLSVTPILLPKPALADDPDVCLENLTARSKSGKVQLLWTPTAADSYNVYRSTTSAGPYTLLANTTSTYSTYLDVEIVNGTRYFYIIRPVATGHEICLSNEISIIPQVGRSRIVSPVDCVVSNWSNWDSCSAECGGGEQSRIRTVLTEPAGSGAACPNLTETQSCNDQACAVDCVVSDWSNWDSCSAECGGGEQGRARTVLTEPAGSGAACPNLTETQSCNDQACADGPAAMELRLSQKVINGSDSLPFMMVFYDNTGSVSEPASEAICEITSDPGESTGTPPVIIEQSIQTLEDTRGTFHLTCSLPGTALLESEEFIVIRPAEVGVSSQPELYGNLSGSANTIADITTQLALALADNNLGIISGLRSDLLTARDSVDLIALKRSTAFAPEGGFPPTPDELTAAGFPAVADDAILNSTLTDLIDKIEEVKDFISGIDPLNLTDADGDRFNTLNDEINILVEQFTALEPSVNGIVSSASLFNLLLADTFPSYLHAMANLSDQALQLHGLASNFRSPMDVYTSHQASPGAGADGTVTLTDYYANIKPTFFGLVGLMMGNSIQGQLITALYGPAFTYLENALITLAFNDLLGAYLNNGTIDGITTGGSVSFHLFNAPGSMIEGAAINPIASRNDVFLVGPDQINAVRDLINAFNPSEVEDLDSLWDFFEGIVDALGGAQEAYDGAYQVPDSTDTCWLWGDTPPCRMAVYSSGFRSVYECSGWFCLSAPVLIITHNLDNGYWAWGLYNFMP